MATQQSGGAPPGANKISIITKSEIRYEGILYHINPQDQSITLYNVKSFGTEGRRPGSEIEPSPQVHEYIVFRGTDIKDLKVLEQGQAQPETQQADTKPIQTQQHQHQHQQQQPVEQTKTQVQHKEPEISMKGDNQEFDFNGMQEKFQKFTLEHQSDVKVKGYNHDNFFDDLSTSTNERTREAPFDRVAQKKVDKETFGSEYVDSATHRGRGGRGRGRGNYRGGYNRNYQGGGNRGGYQGGQNRNYGGNYQGNNNYQGGGGNYQGGGGNYQGGYQGQNRNYQGGQQRKYGGGQGNYGGNQGGYGNREGGNQGGYGNREGGNQGGYGNREGGHYGGNQGGYGNREGGRYGGNQNYGNREGGNYGGNQEGGYQGGQRYQKKYQPSGEQDF